MDWAFSGSDDQDGPQISHEEGTDWSDKEEDDENTRRKTAQVMENEEQLRARGMPDYSSWELKDLQVSYS